MEEAEMAREQTSCTVAMQAACECVCDLHGMHLVEEDLKGSLLMAMRFPEADPTPSPEAEAEGGAEEEAEVAKLQERASTLRRFVGLMEEGLLLQAKELPLLQAMVKDGMEFEHNHGEVPEYLSQLMSQGGQGGQQVDRQLQSG